MSGKRTTLSRRVIFLIFLAHPSFFGLGAQEKNDQSLLPRILTQTAAYCRTFGSATLNYVCLEDVLETNYSPYRVVPWSFDGVVTSSKKNHLVYDYQVVKKGDDIREQRILLEDNGKKVNAKGASLQVKRFPYRNIVLGPMLLSEYWQNYHDYKVVGRERVGKEPCLIIEAVPKPSIILDHLFGKIWVGERNFKIWKLEWYQESIDNFQAAEEMAKLLNAIPQIKISMEYAFEEKGIRFPSKYVLSEEYINQRGVHYILSVLTVVFKNYKFFTVETEVELKKGA